jgi:hypothetical protein
MDSLALHLQLVLFTHIICIRCLKHRMPSANRHVDPHNLHAVTVCACLSLLLLLLPLQHRVVHVP